MLIYIWEFSLSLPCTELYYKNLYIFKTCNIEILEKFKT